MQHIRFLRLLYSLRPYVQNFRVNSILKLRMVLRVLKTYSTIRSIKNWFLKAVAGYNY